MTDYWNYRAKPIRTVDGDTFDLMVDLGFRVQFRIRVRLADVDTAEIYGTPHGSEEYLRGMDQAQYVDEYLFSNPDGREWPLRLKSFEEKGKYGRWIADVSLAVDDESDVLSKKLIAKWPEVESPS